MTNYGIVPGENQLDTITNEWVKQPKFLEWIRNPKLIVSRLEIWLKRIAFGTCHVYCELNVIN